MYRQCVSFLSRKNVKELMVFLQQFYGEVKVFLWFKGLFNIPQRYDEYFYEVTLNS